MNTRFLGSILLLLLFFIQSALAQQAPNNWFNLDLEKDKFPGMSTLEAKSLLQNRTGKEVVVAIIDSGVDIEHEDLQGAIWVNSDEIPNNGKDDDDNGYVDDVHGWNFIGGPNGENVNYENFEKVRLYNRIKERIGDRPRSELSRKEKVLYDSLQAYRAEIDEKQQSAEQNLTFMVGTMGAFDAVVEAIGKAPEEITKADLESFESEDLQISSVLTQIMSIMEANSLDFKSLYGQVKEGFDYYKGQAEYNWNVEFDARNIVGDDPSNLNDRYYGNNDVEGPDAGHGTHVAGIVAARAGNGIGGEGVATNVKIMSIRTVPNGDERDKDVANAIRYAVDNGATVINMSFGKGDSPYKKAVDAAVRYARKKDVLLVHAAGNDGKRNTISNNFPNDQYQKKGLFGKKSADNWLEVGASTSSFDEGLTAGFSNYSPEFVDVFAPGDNIFNASPDDGYANNSGTSMAAPMVAGVAAMLRSYFPDLTAKQVRGIIMESVTPITMKVKQPGSEDLVSFSRLSTTGGIVNAKRAVELALKTKGKKKKVKRPKPSDDDPA